VNQQFRRIDANWWRRILGSNGRDHFNGVPQIGDRIYVDIRNDGGLFGVFVRQ